MMLRLTGDQLCEQKRLLEVRLFIYLFVAMPTIVSSALFPRAVAVHPSFLWKRLWSCRTPSSGWMIFSAVAGLNTISCASGASAKDSNEYLKLSFREMRVCKTNQVKPTQMSVVHTMNTRDPHTCITRQEGRTAATLNEGSTDTQAWEEVTSTVATEWAYFVAGHFSESKKKKEKSGHLGGQVTNEHLDICRSGSYDRVLGPHWEKKMWKMIFFSLLSPRE